MVATPERAKNNVLQKEMTTLKTILPTIDDRSLLDAAKRLATEERRATAALLARADGDRQAAPLSRSRAAIDVRLLHAGAAPCRGRCLNRIEAARAARAYPVILELLEQSAISLTAVRLLAPHLTSQKP